MGFARSRTYWQQVAWGLLFGLLGGLGALVFVTIVERGLRLLWPTAYGWQPFSGSWIIVAMLTGGGLVVGVLHHLLLAKQADPFDAIVEGRLDPRSLSASMLVAVVSLLSGSSLGPEVPTGMLGGGLSTWISERLKLPEALQRTNVAAGVAGAYGGLFTAPVAILAMGLELAHGQTAAYFGILLIDLLAALVGFAIFFAIGGYEFSPILRLLELPGFDLRVWHLGVAIPLGLLGAVVGLGYGLLSRELRRLLAPLAGQPIIRCTLAGLVLGLLSMALPLSLFKGVEGLLIVTREAAQVGVGLLIVLAVAKMIATSGALAAGFIGGPIFPLMFAGAAVGAAVHLVFPQIPLAIAVTCLVAAVPAAVTPVPLTIALIVFLIAGIPITEAIPMFVASLVANVVLKGVILGAPGAEVHPVSTAAEAHPVAPAVPAATA
jgi:H+/Cl- antiporter ClcA